MPEPEPTEGEIESVREVAGENSYSYVEELIEALNDSQWARALALVTAWGEYPAGDTVGLEGGREGVLYSSETSREDVRRRMRLLLGLPEERDGSLTGMGGSTAIRTAVIF